MKFFRILPVAVLIGAYCYGTTMAPKPTYQEVLKAAKLIGTVKILSVPKEPKGGFSEKAPPYVTVLITSSFKGLEKGTKLRLLWDSGLRRDKITSHNSFMPLAKPSEIKIPPPSLGVEYFVFLELLENGAHRDIYGWNRRRVMQALPEAHEKEIWPWSWVVFKTYPFVIIPRAKSSYHRRKYLYKHSPKNDYRIRDAMWHFQVQEQGDYWALTAETAVKFKFTGRTTNPKWPVRYVVKKGDTLSHIAEEFYGSEAKWSNILAGNKSLSNNPDLIKPGIELIIPPEKAADNNGITGRTPARDP